MAEEGACETVPEQDSSASFRFEASPPHRALAESLPPDAYVSSIRYRRYAVFDLQNPRENNALYRWANGFHSRTREWVLEDQLLFAEGGAYQQPLIDETERILRNMDFIYDAAVRPWRRCGNAVDVEVVTRDIWTFTPSISLSRSGGENSYAFGFRDANFLGTGKKILLEYDSDEERAGYTVGYTDPAIAGSRWRMRLTYTDNDDGYVHSLRLDRPFFSVYETWSAGTNLDQQKLEENLWFRGDEVAEFDHEIERYEVFGGRAMDTTLKQRVNRWLFGYSFESHEFDFSDSNIPPPELPEDREYSYPYIGFQSVEDEFTEMHNFDYLGRTEDVFVGERYRWALGYSAESLGATRDQVFLQGSYFNTLLAETSQLWTIGSNLRGFWTLDDESFENLWWQVESRYIYKQSTRWALYSGLRLDYTDGLTGENQVVLGGDNGLRGYERNYQVGNRSAVWNIEQRYYSDWHPFQLFNVGLAAFLDVGRAWYDNRDNGDNGGVLADVGLGLRLNSSRAEKGSVIHLDVAVPFVKDDDVDGVQILVTVRDRF